MSDDEIVSLDLLDERRVSSRYTDDYKDAVFYTWFSRGKVVASTLLGYIEPDVNGNIPSEKLLKTWIRDEFTSRAVKLDEIVQNKLDTKVVEDKVKMLEDHVKIAIEMQSIAITYLRENQDKLRPNTALKMLIDGIRIERESRGLPSLITETLNTTDEALFESLNKLINSVDLDENDLSDLQ